MKTLNKKSIIELKKDYDREKLCKYFCNLCELKYIDLFDPFIFWNFVKYETTLRGHSLEIQIKDCRWENKRYYVRLVHSCSKGEYFEDLEYGILYMIAKSLKKQIEQLNLYVLKNGNENINYKSWEKYKENITKLAFEAYTIRKG